MKFLHLVWAGIWRKPVRAILTLASIVMAFLLFGLLQGFVSGLGASVKLTHADMLLTFSRVSQVEPLPISEAQQIRTVPGVASVTPVILFIGSYRTPAQLAAMKNDRAGALLSPAMARYGWKVGDKVPIRSALWTNRDGKNVWDLDIVGTHGGSTDDMFRNLVLVNYDYVDQARTSSHGTASLFVLKIADPNRAAAIAQAVDALFANSPHETKTASQRQIAQDQLKQISGLGVAVQAILGPAFFAPLV